MKETVIQLGKTSTGKPLKFPLELQTLTSAVLGIRGSGKSYTGAVIVEDLLAAGQAVSIVDPLDVWWGLKASADGKSPGYPIVVLGGDHADLPLAAGDGATVADFVVDERISAIVSLRHFRKHEQREFVTAFAEQIYHRKGENKNRVPLFVVLDEADAFVPQRVGDREARMVGSIEDLVRRGRSSGIGVMLISQRAASVNKDVLTQIELLIAHRHTSPQDRKALQEWIQAHDIADRGAEFLKSLAGLERGTAWAWSPGWLDVFERVAVRARRTFDSSATPKPGAVMAQPRKLADVDLAGIKAKLSKTIEQARANDPAELKKRISALERQLAEKAPAAPSSRPDPAAIAAAVNAALRANDNRWFAHLNKLASVFRRVKTSLDHAHKSWTEADALWAEPPAACKFVPVAKPASPAAPPAPRPPAPSRSPATAGGMSRSRSGKDRMLVALAQCNAPTSSKALGLLAGLSSRTGTWSTYLSELRRDGLVDGPGDALQITAAGMNAAGDFEPLPTGAELIRYWSNWLGEGGKRRIFDCLVEAHPESLSSEDVAAKVGLSASTGTWSTYLSELRGLNLIEGPGKALKASDHLFE